MRVILLTQYFPPETGAPQNRLFELARYLQKKDCSIEVMTAMPNYPIQRVYDGYRGKFMLEEEMEGMRVIRSWIYVGKNKQSTIGRLLNYFSFNFTAFWIGWIKLKKGDVLICESPPLFLGITGVFLAWFKRASFVFNVSDLWPESVEKLGVINNRSALRFAYALEKWLYRRSKLITGQTQGIVKSIQDRHPDKPVHWLPNSCDLTLFDPAIYPKREPDGKVMCLYAGIIGLAQGLHTLLDAAKLLESETHIRIQLAGSGPELEGLKTRASEMGLSNVEFLGAFPKAEMPGVIAQADLSLIPLKKLELFLGAIPSKIFENCAMEKALILGVEGEARDLFIDEANAGWAYEPENAEDLARCIREAASNPNELTSRGQRGRRYVMEKFERGAIANALLTELYKIKR